MDKNKINKNEDKDNHLSNNQKTSIEPKRHISQKFSTTLVNQKESIFIDNLSKEIDRYNKLKRIKSKNEIHNNIVPKQNNHVNSQKDISKFQKNLGFSLHDSIYLGGTDLKKNIGIRTNDINNYLSNISMIQPESKYKLIEKNLQNKILDISMEIFEKRRSQISSEISNNESFKKKKTRVKKLSKNSVLSIDKKQKNKSTHKLLPNFQKTLSMRPNENSNTFIMLKEQQIEKNRKIRRIKVLYDSFAEDESDENIEEEGFGLSPESIFFDIYDCIMLICSLFSLFYVPLRLAYSKLLIDNDEYLILSMIHLSEIIYIFDLLFGFFRWYYNNELKLVKNNNMVIKNYLLGNFLFDLIEAIPFYTILKYVYLDKENNKSNILFNEYHFGIKILTCLKAFKIFKINNRQNNRAFYFFSQKSSDDYFSERIYQISIFSLSTISVLNIFICFHIYMAKLSYPNWILSSKLQDKPFIEIYLASLYFILATMTSVGYGDIVCKSKEETIYQIILLSIGIVAYSWIISTVGDYVKNESRATIKYNKDVLQLEEIRIAYPNMPFKLYNKIHQHLERLVKQQEKYDSNILINSLPYNLKNKLIFEIHKEVIKNFIFFNGCENSDFILKVITHFIPLSSKKNSFLIKEGEIIENIFFVKDGKLALEAAIDLDNIEESVERYLEYQFDGISSIVESEYDNSIEKIIKEDKSIEKKPKVKNYKDLFNLINKQTRDIGDVSYMHESHIEEEIGRCDLNGEGEDFDISNYQFLRILDILKNEHFGELYMLLNKPSPLSLRVKSKKVDLFLLRKKDAINIRKDYPNIWKRIDDKAMYNMKSIKSLTKKVVNTYCKFNGIIQEKDIEQRSDHLFGFNDPENSPKKEKSKQMNSSNNTSVNRATKSKKRLSSALINKMSLSNRKNSNSFNIFSKNPRKTQTYKPFQKGIFLNKSRKSSLIESKNTIKNKNTSKRVSKSNVLNRKKTLKLKDKILSESKDMNKSSQKGKTVRHKKSIIKELNNSLSSSLSFSKSDKSNNEKLNKNKNESHNIEEIKSYNESSKKLEEKSKAEHQTKANHHHHHHNFKKVKNKNSFNNILFQISKIQEPQMNCQVSSTTFSTKNLYNNLVNIFDNKHQNINQINNFNNNLTNYNNLVIANTNLLCQIPEMSNGQNSSCEYTKCKCSFFSPNKLAKESIVKFEIKASYKNINLMAKGSYIKNQKFQKATQKFVNYYFALLSKNRENINNINKEVSSYEFSSFNSYLQEESIIDKKQSKNSNFIQNDLDRKKSKKSKNENSSQQKKTNNLNYYSFKNEKKEIENKMKSVKNINTDKIHKKILNVCLNNNEKKSIKLISDSKDNLFMKSDNSSNLSEASQNKNKFENKNNFCNTFEEEYNNNIYNIDFDKLSKNCNSDMVLDNANFMSFGNHYLLKKIKLGQINKDNKNENIKGSSSKKIKRINTSKSIVESNNEYNYNFCLIY